MSNFHELLASDAYWQGPDWEPQKPATGGIIFKALAGLALGKKQTEAELQAIDDTYFRFAFDGVVTAPLTFSQEPPIPNRGSLLKLIIDSRRLITSTTLNDQEHWQRFNDQAAAMEQEPFYSGDKASTFVNGDDGVYGVERTVVYAQATASGAQLIGKPSHLLGKGGMHHQAISVSNQPVGTVLSSRKGGVFTQSIVSHGVLLAPDIPQNPSLQPA